MPVLPQKIMFGVERIKHLAWRWVIPLGVCVVAWCLAATSAEAADCGSRARPSSRASCICQPKVKRGKIRQRRRRSSRACLRQALQKAKAACKKQAPRHSFVVKKRRRMRRYCEVMYECTHLRKKQRGARASRRTFRKRGNKRVHFKHRIGRPSRPFARAAKRLRRRHCRRTKKRKPVRFRWRKKACRVKLLMGFKKGHCTISWTCLYKKKKPIYWCK